tara:strand:+ start:464 stop:850 length:387 start_codon:yes stop_codon:yes gene_type:complete
MNKDDIRNIRESLSLSQTEFAKKIGVKLRTVQNYEAGKTSPTAETITKMFALKGDDKESSDIFKKNVGTNLIVPGATVSLDQIVLFVSENEEEFLNHPFIKKMIDEKVSRRLLYLLKNPDKLDEYLNS